MRPTGAGGSKPAPKKKPLKGGFGPSWGQGSELARRERSAGVDRNRYDAWAEGDMRNLPPGATRKTGMKPTAAKKTVAKKTAAPRSRRAK